MPTDVQIIREIEVSHLELQFRAPADQLGATELGDLLYLIDDIIRFTLRYGWGMEPVFPGKEDYVVLVAVQFGSPLKLLALIPKLSGDAKKAVVKFFKNIIFYEQERSIRSANAALKWEEVYAKRIENAKEILALLPMRPHHDEPDAAIDALHRVMKQFDLMQKHPAELTAFDVKDEH